LPLLEAAEWAASESSPMAPATALRIIADRGLSGRPDADDAEDRLGVSGSRSPVCMAPGEVRGTECRSMCTLGRAAGSARKERGDGADRRAGDG
jgi:hypothetical protein